MEMKNIFERTESKTKDNNEVGMGNKVKCQEANETAGSNEMKFHREERKYGTDKRYNHI